jgi:hypothetical protein
VIDLVGKVGEIALMVRFIAKVLFSFVLISLVREGVITLPSFFGKLLLNGSCDVQDLLLFTGQCYWYLRLG